jgi:LmbE family N-acetylglucosaminyl deacetylase
MSTNKKRILVVAAHPDDEVLGCGGTIAKHSEMGDLVNVVFLTDGVGSRSNVGMHELESRRRSAEAVRQILGINHIKFGEFSDNKLDELPLIEIIKFIETEITSFKPDVVYTHSSLDLNIDHQIANRAVITATRPQKNCSVNTILCFETLSSTEWYFSDLIPAFKPNWFENITETFNKKIKAIEAYHAELRDWPHPRSVQGITHLASLRGGTVGVEAAEAFMLLRHTK